MKYLFTSESVTPGHPDKMMDQVSDAILDAVYEKDPNARVAAECLTKTGFVIVAGEITTDAYVDIPAVVRKTIKEIGYNNPEFGFDGDTCGVITAISEQSPDIALGVVKDEPGAGDQGLMFGYATNETAELMPLPIILAHKLVMKLTDIRKKGKVPYLRPDGKSQVTVEYEDGQPKKVTTVVISTQHAPDATQAQIKQDMIEHVIKPVCEKWLTPETVFHVNPTGKFVVGGPVADSGLTGRKIIVDTYGGHGSHGGGCFSGKDPSKVDRSASYMCRYIAKNIVGAGLAAKCEVQLAYAIGVAEPVSIYVDTFGTGKVSNENLIELIRKNFRLTPKGIIDSLKLRRPIYQKTAAYGHFGRDDPDFTWEQLDKTAVLKKDAGL